MSEIESIWSIYGGWDITISQMTPVVVVISGFEMDGTGYFRTQITSIHPKIKLDASVPLPVQNKIISMLMELHAANISSDDPASYVDQIPGVNELTMCPVENCQIPMKLRGQVIHLNDSHKWTREAIADWIETLDIDTTIGTI